MAQLRPRPLGFLARLTQPKYSYINQCLQVLEARGQSSQGSSLVAIHLGDPDDRDTDAV